MQEIFRKLLEMSMLGSLLALAVIAVRLIFRKAPRWIYCVLWGMVAVRLILPFSVESKISAVPASVATGQILNQVADRYVGSVEVYYESDPHYSNALDAGRLPAYSADGAYVVTQQGSLEAPATVGDTVFPVLFGVWLVGMAGMLVYLLISYWVLRRKVAEATLLRDNIWQCERISPFVLGVLRPRIYLPYALSEGDATHVIAHEQAHIRRRDYLWKPIGFVLLSIHWFNPVMWAAYILLCRDVERACDEKVIKNMDKVQMQAYSTALLHCSAHRRRIAACPLAFGEVGVKERIKRVMYYKKPAFWVIMLVCVVSVVACVLLMTAPEPADRALVKTEYRVTATLYSTATKEDDRYTGFRITEDGTFYAQREGTDTWNHRSTMEEYPLTAEQLRAYAARKENWRPGYTLDSISEALIAREENGYFFLAAQCAQGDTLVGFGREDPTEGTYLRYLYQVEPVTAEEPEEPREDTDVSHEHAQAEKRQVDRFIVQVEESEERTIYSIAYEEPDGCITKVTDMRSYAQTPMFHKDLIYFVKLDGGSKLCAIDFSGKVQKECVLREDIWNGWILYGDEEYLYGAADASTGNANYIFQADWDLTTCKQIAAYPRQFRQLDYEKLGEDFAALCGAELQSMYVHGANVLFDANGMAYEMYIMVSGIAGGETVSGNLLLRWYNQLPAYDTWDMNPWFSEVAEGFGGAEGLMSLEDFLGKIREMEDSAVIPQYLPAGTKPFRLTYGAGIPEELPVAEDAVKVCVELEKGTPNVISSEDADRNAFSIVAKDENSILGILNILAA